MAPGASYTVGNLSGHTKAHFGDQYILGPQGQFLSPTSPASPASQDRANRQLLLAAQQGQTELIRRRVKEGADIDATRENGYTSLHLAVLSQSADAIKCLVDLGANQCAFADEVGTPLHLAIVKRYCHCAELLLGARCWDSVDGLGTVLHIAAYVGDLGIIERIRPMSLEARLKANISLAKYARVSGIAATQQNARDWIGDCTPVMLAALRGGTAVLNYLLELPARKTCSNGSIHWGSHTLSRSYTTSSARTSSSRSFVEVRSGALEDKDDLQKTAIMLAAEQGHLECAQLLSDANINQRTAKGDSAMSLALRGLTDRHCETASYLLELEADYDLSLEGRENVLHLAARNGHGNFMRRVIPKLAKFDRVFGARKGGKKIIQQGDWQDALNALNIDGMTPLMLAASKGSEICCDHLLHAGAKVNFRDPKSDECTALVHAATHGHHRFVKLLIESDANLMPKASAGETPLHKAAEKGHYRVLNVIIDHAGPKVLQLLAAVDRNGNMPLHTAALNNQDSCVKVLLRAGANMYAINRQSFSPRDIAIKGRYRAVEELFSDHEQDLIRKRHLRQQNEHADDSKAKSRSMQPMWKALERMHLIGTLGSRYGVDR